MLKATHTVYEGTDIPKDFRSRVQLRNPQTGEDREVEISMNHPLRYAGLTFYQYQMDAGQAAREAGRAPSSVLQVVHNPSWLTPYIGCALVALGLSDPIHVPPRRLSVEKENEMKKLKPWLPLHFDRRARRDGS